MKKFIPCILSLILGMLIGVLSVIGTDRQNSRHPGVEAQLPISNVGGFVFYAGEVFVVSWVNWDETEYHIVKVAEPEKVKR